MPIGGQICDSCIEKWLEDGTLIDIGISINPFANLKPANMGKLTLIDGF